MLSPFLLTRKQLFSLLMSLKHRVSHSSMSMGESGRLYYLETMGSGVAFLDYDNDADLDLYIVNGAPLPGFVTDTLPTNVLYRNDGNRGFTDVTAEAGVGHLGYGMGCGTADYDNDGDPDLYVTNFGENVLYRNNADGTFTDVTVHASVGDDDKWSSSCAFVDYDHDGNLDLYVVNYLDYTIVEDGEWYDTNGQRIYSNPRVYEGVSDTLYRNNGDGTFIDVTQHAGVYNDTGKGLGVTCGDYDNDGRIDIYVANDTTPNFLYRNMGDGTFVDLGIIAGVAYNEDGVAEGGMGVDFGDYNNDGFLDIFVTNFSRETNTLYHNNSNGIFTDVTYIAHLGDPSFLKLGFGTKFFDADNDGNLGSLCCKRTCLFDRRITIRYPRICTNRPTFPEHGGIIFSGCLRGVRCLFFNETG